MARGTSVVSVAQKLRVAGPGGVSAEIDVGKIKATPAQKQALQKLLASGDLASLQPPERNLIKDLKARIRPGANPMLIVRFDWKWVRIDEPADAIIKPVTKPRAAKRHG